MKQKTFSGFTLLEVLLVVAIIAILAGIVILAINPGKQLGDARNAQRSADVNTILNGVYQYAVDNNGVLPSGIKNANSCGSGDITYEVCRTDGNCKDRTDLSVLTNAGIYLVAIPTDPQSDDVNGSGYFAIKNANDRVTVCAPGAEQGATISVTR